MEPLLYAQEPTITTSYGVLETLEPIIFEYIAERKWILFILNFLAACLVYFSICYLVIWTKSVCDKKNKKM